MAKRSRGSTRPGQRRPLQRSTRPAQAPARPAAASPASAGPVATGPASSGDGGLTAAEEARAAALESAIVADERASQSGSRGREGSAPAAAAAAATPATAGRRPSAGGLAVAYAHEYDYVRRDLRRITVLAAVLIVALFGIFFAITSSGAISF
jgi:hypothetical protein